MCSVTSLRAVGVPLTGSASSDWAVGVRLTLSVATRSPTRPRRQMAAAAIAPEVTGTAVARAGGSAAGTDGTGAGS
eukprot:12518079-Heterocapsa_arctica.AAC.1